MEHLRQQWRKVAMEAEFLPDGDGDCYPVAAKLVAFGTFPDGKVCHGIVTGQEEVAGIRFGHAWVEIQRGGQTYCVDQSNGNNVVIAKSEYYRIGHIDPKTVHRYDQTETMVNLARHKHWGPWD